MYKATKFERITDAIGTFFLGLSIMALCVFTAACITYGV